MVVRRPEEKAVFGDIAPDSTTLQERIDHAVRSEYAVFKDGPETYLFSPQVLPLAAWARERAAVRGILAKLTADGTLHVASDSAEGRFVASRTDLAGKLSGDLTIAASPTVSATMEFGGKTVRLPVNAAMKPHPTTPDHAVRQETKREGKGSEPAPEDPPMIVAMNPQYEFESYDPGIGSVLEEFALRTKALATLNAEIARHLREQAQDERRLYDGIAAVSLRESLIPSRGATFASLPKAVQDNLEDGIRSNYRMHGFADEGDAIKWLAGARITRTDVWMGLSIDAGGSRSAAMLASRRY